MRLLFLMSLPCCCWCCYCVVGLHAKSTITNKWVWMVMPFLSTKEPIQSCFFNVPIKFTHHCTWLNMKLYHALMFPFVFKISFSDFQNRIGLQLVLPVSLEPSPARIHSNVTLPHGHVLDPELSVFAKFMVVTEKNQDKFLCNWLKFPISISKRL